MTTGNYDADRLRGHETSGMSSSSDVGSQVQDAAGQAKEKAGQVAEQAKQTTTSRANEQKEKAVDSLGSVARAVGDVGNQLRDQNPALARYADMASEKIDQLAGQLNTRDVTDLMADVEDYARRNPAMFLGGAFVLGMAGARFLKSSRPASSSFSSQGEYQYRGPGGYRTADTRYSGYPTRAATPPRTSYQTAGYQQPTTPAYNEPDQTPSYGQSAGRDAFGDTSRSTTESMRPGVEEGRHGTR